MMMRAPEKIPAEPIPAIARPIMRVGLSGAAPQMREPISNRAMAVKKTDLIGRKE